MLETELFYLFNLFTLIMHVFIVKHFPSQVMTEDDKSIVSLFVFLKLSVASVQIIWFCYFVTYYFGAPSIFFSFG